MTPSARVDVVPMAGLDDSTPAMSRVRVDGRADGPVVRGAVLEAAVELDDRLVLFLSDGVPWEEGLNVHLLDAAFVCVDSVALGWPYTPGMFSDLRLQAPDTIEFCFPGNTRWRVTVRRSRRLAWPMSRGWPGVSRPVTWWRWLELTRLTR